MTRYSVPPKDPVGDAILLVLSVLVVTLACCMQVRNEQQVLVPGTSIPLPELCSFRRWTGIDCPGCGMTRAFISVAHGDVVSAWNYNPASLYFFGLVGLQIPFRSVQLWRLRCGRSPLLLGGWSYLPLFILMILILGQWAIRFAGRALDLG